MSRSQTSFGPAPLPSGAHTTAHETKTTKSIRCSRRVPRMIGRGALLLAIPLALLVVGAALPTTVRASQQTPQGGSNATISFSPQSGPVGVNVTATGSHFPAGDPVQIGYSATSDCASMTAINGATGTAGKDGGLSVTTAWPQTNVGTYTVCAKDTKTNKTYAGTNPFNVLSASPVSLTISSPVVSSKSVTVNGANFLPGGTAVEVFYGVQGTGGAAAHDVCAQSAGTKTTDAKGNFTLTFTAPFYSINTPLVITAVSPQETCNGTPVLMARKTVTVLAAASATQSAQKTPATQPENVTNTKDQIWPPSGIWSVVDCLVGLLLFLLLLLALLVASRNRSQNQPPSSASPSAQPRQPTAAGGRLMGSTQVSVGPDGRPLASEQIYAQGKRGAPVHVANVEDSVEEEPMPDLTPPGGANPPTPRYGPPRY